MADNVEDPGTGATFATKETDVGTGLAHVQFVREASDSLILNFGPFALDDVDPWTEHEVLGHSEAASVPEGLYEVVSAKAMLIGSGAPCPDVELALVRFDPDDPPTWPADGDPFATPIFAGLATICSARDFDLVGNSYREGRTLGVLTSIPVALSSVRAFVIAEAADGPATSGDQVFVGVVLRRLGPAPALIVGT